MSNDGVEKVAARLSLDITPAQRQLLQLQEDIRRFGTQTTGVYDQTGEQQLQAQEQINQRRRRLSAAQEENLRQIQQDGELKRTLLFNTHSQQMVQLQTEFNTRMSALESEAQAAHQVLLQQAGVRTAAVLMATQTRIDEIQQTGAVKREMIQRQANERLEMAQEHHNQKVIQSKEITDARIATLEAESQARIDERQAAGQTKRELAQRQADFRIEQEQERHLQSMLQKQGLYEERLRQMQERGNISSSSRGLISGISGHLAQDTRYMVNRVAADLTVFAIMDELMKIPKTIGDVSAGMTKLKQVLELSDQIKGVQQLNDSLGQLQQVAERQAVLYGRDVSEVLDVMTQAGRRFKDVPSIIVATDNALQAMVADNVDAEKAIKGEEAMMQQFGLSLGETRDAWAKLTVASHVFLTDATGIIDAIERSGSAFHGMKMNTDSAIASIVALAQESGRTGSVVGNTFKSLITSLETDKGVKALHQIGIEARLSNGQLQDGLTVLSKLQEKWPQLSEVSRQAFANVLSGGKYQINQLLTFLNDTSGTYVKALDEMKKANQETQQELVRSALESLPVQAKMTSASLQVMANSFSNVVTPAMMRFFASIREGTAFVSQHANAIEHYIGLGMKLVEAYAAWKIGLSLWNAVVDSSIIKTALLNTRIVTLTFGLGGASAGFKALGVSMAEAGASAAAVTARIAALVVVVSAFNSEVNRKSDPLGAKEKDLEAQIETLKELRDTPPGEWERFKTKLSTTVQVAWDSNFDFERIHQNNLTFASATPENTNKKILELGEQLADIKLQRVHNQEEEQKKQMDEYQKMINDALEKADKTHPPPPPLKNGSDTTMPDSGKGKKKKGSKGNAGSDGQKHEDVTGPYAADINAAAHQYGLDPALIKAIAKQESDLGAASSNVMQVNGYNGKGAKASIFAGAKEFASVLKKAGGDTTLALAAYNMGPGILDYFNAHGGYSAENMQAFSNMQKKKHGYKIYGDPNYVSHVLRYYKGGSGNSSSPDDSANAEDFSQPYKDSVSGMEKALTPYLDMNKQLDGILSQLTMRHQAYSDLLKHGATDTRLAADETNVYQQRIESLKLHQNSLHETNEQMRADMARIKKQMQALNPYNEDISKLPKGQQDALQSLSQEYDKLSQQVDQNSQKWAEDQKNITQSTLDWLDAIYQLQDNGLKALDDQIHQNNNDVKAAEQNMSMYSDALKRNANDLQALKGFAAAYHQEVAKLAEQNNLLSQENEKIKADNKDLQEKIEQVNQRYKAGKITLDAYQAALQSLNNEIQKNNDKLNENTNQQAQNDTAKQAATDKIREQIVSYLQKSYEAEQKYQEQTLQDAYEKKKALLEKEKQDAQDAADAQIKALEDQKAAIDDTINALERQWQAQDNVNKLSDLQNQLDQVTSQKDHEIVDINGNLTYTYDVQKAQDLQKQISDEQTQIARNAQKQQLEDQKASLDKQIQNLRDHEQQVQQQYDNELKTVEDTYNQQKQFLDDYWKFRLEQDQLNQEADNLILKQGTDQALLTAQAFADQMIAKYNSITQAAREAAAAMANAMGAQSADFGTSGGGGGGGGGSSASGSSGSGKINTSTLSGYAKTYADAINSGKSASEAASAAASKNGTGTDGKGNVTSSSKSSSSVPKMATGATVTSPTLALIGEGGEPEHVIPDSKLQALLSPGNFTRLPGIKAPTITDFSRIQAPSIRTIVQTVQISKLEFPSVRTAADAGGFTTDFSRMMEKWYHAGEM